MRVRKAAGNVRRRLRKVARRYARTVRSKTRALIFRPIRAMYLARARAAFKAGQYEAAQRNLDSIFRRRPNDRRAADLAIKISVKQGSFSEAANRSVLRALNTGMPSHWDHARKLQGRIRETDHRWQPIVSAPPPRHTPRERVIYLAKESRPYLHNGFCTRTHEALQALVKAGLDIECVTMPGFPAVIGIEEGPAQTRVENVVYRHLLPRAGRLVDVLSADEYVQLSTQVLAGVVGQRHPALLHVGSGHRGFETALVGNSVARWAQIPWLYEVRSFFETTWTSDPRYMEQGEYFTRRFQTETRMMSGADLVITLSGPMRDEIINKHGVSPEQVRVVPNAVDLMRFRPIERNALLRKRLGLAGTTVGYVSNLSHPREGQEVLIEAIAHLRRAGLEVSCLLVGDGTRRRELERLSRRLGVGDRVTFAGSVPFDQVAAYYAQIDLFVVPRVDERAARMVSPMKPFEAMAMRIPVMVADLPALVEIADGGERSHLFRAGDARSLASEIERLIGAPDEQRRLAKVAAEWVETHRSWSAVAAGFTEAYDELLSERVANARAMGA